MTEWHKSSYSGGTNNCVEVRETLKAVDVRDTQNRALGHVEYTPDAWVAFLRNVKTGR